MGEVVRLDGGPISINSNTGSVNTQARTGKQLIQDILGFITTQEWLGYERDQYTKDVICDAIELRFGDVFSLADYLFYDTKNNSVSFQYNGDIEKLENAKNGFYGDSISITGKKISFNLHSSEVVKLNRDFWDRKPLSGKNKNFSKSPLGK